MKRYDPSFLGVNLFFFLSFLNSTIVALYMPLKMPLQKVVAASQAVLNYDCGVEKKTGRDARKGRDNIDAISSESIGYQG